MLNILNTHSSDSLDIESVCFLSDIDGISDETPSNAVLCLCCFYSDKAGGNKFAKDFEEGSLKLQEFVSFLEQEMKTGPPLLEALGNADIFYEMQYKEVKIVANVSVP